MDWKGVEYLIDAFARVRSSVPATLDIIGDGPRRSALETQVRERSLGESVIFRGWLTQSECALHFHQADVFVLPSLYESGGAVVLEAMASGLPVIATDWGGPSDYIDPSCGILVTPRSPDSFAADLAVTMLKLAQSPELRQALGRAGSAKVRREYDWERKIDRMLEIYEGVRMKTSG